MTGSVIARLLQYQSRAGPYPPQLLIEDFLGPRAIIERAPALRIVLRDRQPERGGFLDSDIAVNHRSIERVVKEPLHLFDHFARECRLAIEHRRQRADSLFREPPFAIPLERSEKVSHAVE